MYCCAGYLQLTIQHLPRPNPGKRKLRITIPGIKHRNLKTWKTGWKRNICPEITKLHFYVCNICTGCIGCARIAVVMVAGKADIFHHKLDRTNKNLSNGSKVPFCINLHHPRLSSRRCNFRVVPVSEYLGVPVVHTFCHLNNKSNNYSCVSPSGFLNSICFNYEKFTGSNDIYLLSINFSAGVCYEKIATLFLLVVQYL